MFWFVDVGQVLYLDGWKLYLWLVCSVIVVGEVKIYIIYDVMGVFNMELDIYYLFYLQILIKWVEICWFCLLDC